MSSTFSSICCIAFLPWAEGHSTMMGGVWNKLKGQGTNTQLQRMTHRKTQEPIYLNVKHQLCVMIHRCTISRSQCDSKLRKSSNMNSGCWVLPLQDKTRVDVCKRKSCCLFDYYVIRNMQRSSLSKKTELGFIRTDRMLYETNTCKTEISPSWGWVTRSVHCSRKHSGL